MANEEHLEILMQGVEVWNEWRKNNPGIIPQLNESSLWSYEHLWNPQVFSRPSVNLSRVNFSRANLCRLRFQPFLGGGRNTIRVDLSEADLSEADLIEADLTEADLQGANLSGADLSRANLNGANLSEANLSGANLNRANLSRANLNGAIITGASIDSWIIKGTNLEGIKCEHIYLETRDRTGIYMSAPKNALFTQRRPHSGNFALGEFTKLFQEIENTIDLIFHNGINWQAFAIAFNQVNTRILDANEEGEIFLREYKVLGDGLIVLKVTTPPGSDKDKLRDELRCAYKKIAELEGELKATNNLLAFAFERLLLPSTQINKGTFNIQNIQNVEGDANLMSEAKKEYTFNASVGSVENQGHIASSGNQNTIGNAAGEAQSELKSIQHIYNYAPEQKQTLAEAVTEIQQLLKQLEQTNPTATEAQQIEHINNETSPNFKRRFASALQAFGETAIDEFVLENKWLKVIKETGKRWMKPE